MVLFVNATLRPLYPQAWPGTHCVGGWGGPTAGLDGRRKSGPQIVSYWVMLLLYFIHLYCNWLHQALNQTSVSCCSLKMVVECRNTLQRNSMFHIWTLYVQLLCLKLHDPLHYITPVITAGVSVVNLLPFIMYTRYVSARWELLSKVLIT